MGIFYKDTAKMGRKLIDLTGQKFGRLTVLKLHHIKTIKTIKNRIQNVRYYLCKCECGNEHIVSNVNLKNGGTLSCGCYNKENRKKVLLNAVTKHGLSKTRIYKIYLGMKKRCYNENCKSYKDYGGRGITICEEWLSDFMNFYNWAVNNNYKDSLTIERIDVNKNYCPENCKWITLSEQQLNKTITHYLTYKNETKCMSEWGKILKIKRGKMNHLVNDLSYTIEDIIRKENINYVSH